jgi:phosphatidylglycerophosphatase A
VPGGLGIMLDDLIAGAMAAILLALAAAWIAI